MYVTRVICVLFQKLIGSGVIKVVVEKRVIDILVADLKEKNFGSLAFTK